MFTQLSFPSGSTVFRVVPHWINNFMPAFLAPDVVAPQKQRKGIRPATGPEDDFGERNCIHHNVTQALLSPKVGYSRVPYPSSPAFWEYQEENAKLGDKASWHHITCFLPFGWSGAMPPELSGERSLYSHYDWRGLTCCVATTDLDSLSWYSEIGWVECEFFRTSSGAWSSRMRSLKRRKSECSEAIPTSGYCPFDTWSKWTGSAYSRTIVLRGGSVDNLITRKEWERRLVHAFQWLGYHKISEPDDWKGTLSQQIAEQAKAIDTNVFTLIPELLSLKKGVQGTLDQLAGLRSDRSIRKLADLELSLKYGVQLTVKDVVSQCQRLFRYQVTRNGACRARARLVHSTSVNVQGTKYPVTIRYGCKTWYDPTPDSLLQNAIWQGLSWGVIPSLENAWDIIPYSFVIDWFTNFSTTLNQLDAKTLIAALEVEAALFSRNLSVTLPMECIPDLADLGTGRICLTDYSRLDLGGLFSPKPSFVGFQQFTSLVEAGAILTQIFTKK